MGNVADNAPLTDEQRDLAGHPDSVLLARREAAHVARQTGLDYEECVRGAMLGLTDAARRFDSAQSRWTTYAPLRIRGAIYTHLRSVAGRSQCDPKTRVNVHSLDGMRGGGKGSEYRSTGSSGAEGPDWQDALRVDCDPAAAMDAADGFAGLVALARPDDRRLLELYFRDGMTMRAIGAQLGLSESWVSQKMADIISQLRQSPGVAHAVGHERVNAGGVGGGGGEEVVELPGGGGGVPADVQPAAGAAAAGDGPVCAPGEPGAAGDDEPVGGSAGEAAPERRGQCGAAADVHDDTRASGAGGPGQAERPEDGVEDSGPVPADSRVARLPGGRAAVAVMSVIPSPREVASKAAVLRDAMLGAVSAADVQGVMGQLVRKAKTGDMAAIRTLLAIIGGGRGA